MDRHLSDEKSNSFQAPGKGHVNYSIQTFGCKVNTYDTGLLQKRLNDWGFKEVSKSTDHSSVGHEIIIPEVHILNTCAVTAEATREAARVARRLKRKNPDSMVVMTGCAAQVDTDQLSELKEADLIVANSHKGDLEDLILKKLSGGLRERVFKSNIFKKMETEPGGGVEYGHTRSFLKIQDGCNSFCTFCVIPFARGKSRSLSIDELVDRTNELNSQGVNEVVLTGVHIGDYESNFFKKGDSNGGLQSQQGLQLQQGGVEDLVEQLLLRTKVPRFRLSSLEPIELSDRLLDLFKEDRLCSHFHMSIQSANSKVLKDMKRKYDQAAVVDALERIEKNISNAFVGMDVIAGFVGETQDEFDDTYLTLKSLPWTRIHVFPYSVRPGTFAERLPNEVPEHQIRERAERLRELSSERYAQKALEQVGSIKSILLLKKKLQQMQTENSQSVQGKPLQGLSRDFWRVNVNGGSETLTRAASSTGEISVRIKGYDHSLKSRMDGYLVGEVLPTH